MMCFFKQNQKAARWIFALILLPGTVLLGQTQSPYAKYRLPDQFQVSFDMYYRLAEPPEKGGPVTGGPISGNVLYYAWNGSKEKALMRADWQECPPFPGIPLTYIGKQVSFFLGYWDNNYQTRAYCADLNQWTYYAYNLGALLPELVVRYQQFDPHPPLDKPFTSSKLPAPPSYTQPNIAWFTTGGPPPEWDQGYYAAQTQPVNGVYAPYSFAGGHMWPKGKYFVQAIYDINSFSTSSLPSGIFNFPTGYTYTPPEDPSIPVFTFPFAGERAGLNCGACHASASAPPPPPGTTTSIVK